MTTEEVAAELKVDKKTLDNWRYAGKGPIYMKIGGSVRYDMADLHSWAKTKRIVPSVQAFMENRDADSAKTR
jgi:predicted site-specific integrase-resolvase